jgi:enterochelin esterase-like enzyme
VAEAITKLSHWGFIQPAIIIGIDNTTNRLGDYLPLKPFDTPKGQAFLIKLKEERSKELEMLDFVADRYLTLIVDEIKPRVDADFRTLSRRESTFVMGSSMGGLISLYALVEYPHIFGGAGCFSTHWPILDEFTAPYLRDHLPEAGHHKLYYDHGTVDLDGEYAPFQHEVDQIMLDKGYTPGKDWLTKIALGADHSERAWRSRIHIALRFFLGQ